MEVEILNWEKYNPRKDIKRPHWFSLSNTLVTDPDFFSFSASEFKAWIYLLSLASQKNSCTVLINFDHAHKVSSIREADFLSALNKLEKLKCVRNTYGSVRDPYATLHNTTLHNITEQNTTESFCTVGLVNPPAPIEIKSNIVSFSKPEDLETIISDRTKKNWSELYPDPLFIRREVLKALNWCETNQARKPKTKQGWSRFLGSWFERGWIKHVKTIQANTPGISQEYMKEILENEV